MRDKPRPPAPIRPEVEALEPSKIVEVWELGLGREDVIPLWVGEGDLPTPDFISEPAYRALKEGKTFYTYKRGLPELQRAIAGYLDGFYGTDTDPQRVTVTCSGMNAILLIMQAIVRPGDEVVVVSPVWPNARAAAQIAGARVVEATLDQRADGGFELDVDGLIASFGERTRAVFIASPGNPTGWMMESEDQRRVLEACRERGIWVIADEVYHRFVYDRPVAPSFMEYAGPEDPLLVVHSFSKTWAMTGWRLGWLVSPPSMQSVFDSLIEFDTSGAQPFLQEGALVAVRDGEDFVREYVERCRQGGELVYQRLAGLPRVHIARPQASFYAFFAVEGVGDSLDFAKQVLKDTGVGLTPGSAFGAGGEGRLRLCFASSHALLSEGVDRLACYLG